MSELKLLEERIKNLNVGLLGMADGETVKVSKTLLETVRKYMAELLELRRAQPENARQCAIETGICPMCEDCPDGCPVEAPNDSRNKPENKPLIKAEVCIDLVEEACRRGHYYDIDTIIEDYRHKPERSEG